MPIKRQFDISKVDPRAIHVMWLVTLKGFEIRLCGGAVRDLLRGITPKDWDMATTALPEQIMAIMQDEGIHVIPTGLQHGTVTAVFEGEHFEITTLRIDAETDGRHATVQYTDDWQLDANRRDFTMNALYLDADGFIHDYVDGVPDLQENFVKFVGDAEERIKEDYLRILRFFRFKARLIMASNTSFVWYDSELAAKDAIIKHREGLNQISGERIWMETSKILQCRFGAFPTTSAMFETGVLDNIGLANMAKLNNMLDATNRLDERPSVLLASTHKPHDISTLHAYMCDGLKMSKAETRPIEFYLANSVYRPTRDRVMRMMLDHKREDVLAWIALSDMALDTTKPIKRSIGQSSNYATNTKPSLYEFASTLVVPAFPVTGKDLIALGMKAGPQMGNTISQLKDVWADLEYSTDKEYLLSLVNIEGDLTDD